MLLLETFNTRIQANLLLNILDQNEIPYILKADDCGGARPELSLISGVKVFVSVSDSLRIKDCHLWNTKS